MVTLTCRSFILCSYSSLLVEFYEVSNQCCRCAVRLREGYRMTRVPPSAHMHTATPSAEKCWLILLWTAWRLSFEGIQFARSIVGIQHARVLVSCIGIRLVRTFSLHVFHFCFYTMSSIYIFLQDQKQFRYAARFVFTLTATEQLHTQVLSAAYPHLATFAPYG